MNGLLVSVNHPPLLLLSRSCRSLRDSRKWAMDTSFSTSAIPPLPIAVAPAAWSRRASRFPNSVISREFNKTKTIKLEKPTTWQKSRGRVLGICYDMFTNRNVRNQKVVPFSSTLHSSQRCCHLFRQHLMHRKRNMQAIPPEILVIWQATLLLIRFLTRQFLHILIALIFQIAQMARLLEGLRCI